jgi:hypothetical protein
LADALLELAFADQRAPAGGAGIDQPDVDLRRLLAHHRLQADRIAQSGEAALAKHDDMGGRGEHDTLYRRGAAWQVNDNPGEFATQLVEQCVDRAGIDDQVLGRRGLGRKDPQIVGHLDHSALDKQAVDTGRLLQRLAQPGAGVGVELERDRAEVKVEIDERHPLAAFLGQEPGTRHGGRRGPDPATAADEHNDLAQAAVAGNGGGRPLLQNGRQRLAGRRLDEVIVAAGGEQVAEQGDIVDVAERDELQLGAADRPRRADLGNRRARLRKIQQQNPRHGTRADPSQRSVERVGDDQLVVQLQLADHLLHPIEHRLMLHHGEDTFAYGLGRSRRARCPHKKASIPKASAAGCLIPSSRWRRGRPGMASSVAMVSASAA